MYLAKRVMAYAKLFTRPTGIVSMELMKATVSKSFIALKCLVNIPHCLCLGNFFNMTDLIHFKLNRFNRLQRLYDNSWLWKDINIGPHGHFIVTVPVPERPALWMVSSFGVSSKFGFGLTRFPIIVRAELTGGVVH